MTTEKIDKLINRFVEANAGKLVLAARNGYQRFGRGYVEVQLRRDPRHYLKPGFWAYVPKEHAEEIHAGLDPAKVNDHDRALIEALPTYSPGADAVIVIWYGMKMKVVVLKDAAMN